VLIAWCVAAWLGAAPLQDGVTPPAVTAPAVTTPAVTEPAVTAQAAAAAAQDPAEPKQKKAKKKKKKTPKETELAPDEAPPEGGDAVDEPGGVRFVWKQHPSIRFGEAVRVDFVARFQEDFHSSYDGAEASAGLARWELHRNRVGIKGFVTRHVEYEVEYELTEKELTEHDVLLGYTPNSQWKDVNVNLTYVKNAQILAGKFKIPFGLDELTGVTHNDFVYRSLGANYLAPARDVGTMVHGALKKHWLTYAVGTFVHDGDNARSKKIQGGDATAAGRVTVRPFQAFGMPTPGVIEVGSAYTFSKVSDDSFRPNGLRGRTVTTQDNFYETVYVKGHRRRWEADVDWTAGPASLRAEYTRVADDRQAQGIGDQDLPDALAHSWYVTGTWALTGEDKRRPIKAAAPLFQGGIGAVELAARVERMWFTSAPGEDAPFRNPRAETIYPEGDRVLTLGINWTLNRFLKLQMNAIREHVEDPERNPVPNGAAFWNRVVRLQFVM
jgi:phosphate-selective porin OprO and OprP